MTTPSITAGQAQFGQALAFAERTLTEVLRRHLAERQVTPETWYALKLIALRGPGLARVDLTSDLERSPTLNPDSTRELLGQLETDRLIRGDMTIDLTTEGETFYRDLHEYVTRPTIRLLSQFDAEDIDTTVRTLQAITKVAAEGLAPS
jgi:hypothetical protein